MQAPGTARDVSSLASYALGLACGTSSSFRLGLPEFQLMRGHIVGPAVRCLYECWAQPSGLLRHAGESLIYFMAVSPVVRSLGRQWLPIEWVMQMPGADLRVSIVLTLIRA